MSPRAVVPFQQPFPRMYGQTPKSSFSENPPVNQASTGAVPSSFGHSLSAVHGGDQFLRWGLSLVGSDAPNLITDYSQMALGFTPQLSQVTSLKKYFPAKMEKVRSLYPQALQDLLKQWLASSQMTEQDVERLKPFQGILEEGVDIVFESMKYYPLTQGLVDDAKMKTVFKDLSEGFEKGEMNTLDDVLLRVNQHFSDGKLYEKFKKLAGLPNETYAKRLFALGLTHFYFVNKDQSIDELKKHMRKQVWGEIDEFIEASVKNPLVRVVHSFILKTLMPFAILPFPFAWATSGIMRRTVRHIMNKNLPKEVRLTPDDFYTYMTFKHSTRSILNVAKQNYGDTKKINKPHEVICELMLLKGVPDQTNKVELMWKALAPSIR